MARFGATDGPLWGHRWPALGPHRHRKENLHVAGSFLQVNSQGIPGMLCNQNVRYSVHNSLPLLPVIISTNLNYALSFDV